MHTSQQALSTIKLFSIPVQYKVPRYQRRYVWDDENWRTLSADIFAQLSLEFEMDDGKYYFKKLESRENALTTREKNHFTGIIVTRRIRGGELELFEVIDGQQRLTTIQIILCVIRDIFKSKGCQKQVRGVNALIANMDTLVDRSGEEMRYKFCPTNYDDSEFKAVVDETYGEYISVMSDKETNQLLPEDKSGIRSEFTNSDSHNILDAYDYFYKLIMDYINQDKDDLGVGWESKLVSLDTNVMSRLEVVQITLDESDYSERIFESINATGRKLSEFDYLRNNLFLRARQLDSPETKEYISEDLYTDYWKDFENDESYWEAEKLESFLINFLITKLGPYCFESDKENENESKKAFEVYQKLYYKKLPNNLTPKEKVEYEFSELQRHANVYREADFGDLDFVNQSDKIRFHMKFYDDLNITSLLPFIIHLKCEANQTNDQLKVVFSVIESYLIRRMVHFGYGRNDKDENAYRRIYKYFSDLIDEDKNKNFNMEEFMHSLENWPDDNQLIDDLQRIVNDTRETNRDLSRERARFQLGYIFYRIERHTNQNYTCSFNDFFSKYKPTRIVSEAELQKEVFGQKRLSESDWKQLQKDWSSIGNLTFSTIEKVNYSFEDLQNVLSTAPDANLRLNNAICKLDKIRSWGRTQIRNRRTDIRRYFTEIWPDEKSIQDDISKQSRKSDKIVKPIEKSISRAEPSNTAIHKMVEEQDVKLKTCRGEVLKTLGSYFIVELLDIEERIRVNNSEVEDRKTKGDVQNCQKVELEIRQTQSGEILRPIKVVRI
ncbi:DUF262 domain-containing protein [Candidatus Poribacteria bacterium]|nr:DUF262 domain-containing protein [Candidatus Poribacteria bacterium]